MRGVKNPTIATIANLVSLGIELGRDAHTLLHEPGQEVAAANHCIIWSDISCYRLYSTISATRKKEVMLPIRLWPNVFLLFDLFFYFALTRKALSEILWLQKGSLSYLRTWKRQKDTHRKRVLDGWAMTASRYQNCIVAQWNLSCLSVFLPGIKVSSRMLMFAFDRRELVQRDCIDRTWEVCGGEGNSRGLTLTPSGLL